MINKYSFDAKEAIDTVVTQWKAWAKKNNMKAAVIGMSGGCDSYVCAGLASCVFGKENVIGVMMPNGTQPDIDDAKRAIKNLGIMSTTIDIADTYEMLLGEIGYMYNRQVTERTKVNLAPRLRMCTLYAIAQSTPGAFVVTTGNLSESILGYTTMWGDMAGDFAPLAGFVKSEVQVMGLALGLIPSLVMKTPSDGLSEKTDEDAFGFSYEKFDKAIRTGAWTPELEARAIPRIQANEFKQPILHSIASVDTGLPMVAPEPKVLD